VLAKRPCRVIIDSTPALPIELESQEAAAGALAQSQRATALS
jgi:hypothetical protein